ncbi:CRISPR-associated endonuclease Cas3'' [Meiothermus cerbereus]|uniref:CRISPR-associated endonuclease Cas3'' n=1 Tax=Meiothermus cerbereus TaxID=65552 RepID=UPI00047F0542|nr:CRISPR-associated endonuclease Cas3'' [Meiothermus cerbereus]
MLNPHDLSYHQNKALRLLRLLELLQQKPWKPGKLRQELGLGERAIFDYLNEVKALAAQLGLRFVHDTLRSTYHIEVQEQLSPTETVVAFIATRMLAHHSPGSNRAYQEALRKLVKHLPEPLKTLALKSISALAERAPSLSGANLETLTQGWLERRVVAFEYRMPQQRTFKVELETYFIEVSRANMAVYLIGKDRLYGRGIHYLDNLKTYKLERIQRPRLLDETYTIPDDFDPGQYLSSAWGIVSSQQPLEVLLRFSPEASERIREGGYPNLQILEQLEGGSTLVQITVGTDQNQFPLELLPWIQSWGPRVEVLKPDSLRQAWLHEARQVLELYSPQWQSAPKVYWAHSHRDRTRWQTLREHATEVARLAAQKAAPFSASQKAELAGKLHDLGKYGDLFQRRLEGKEKGLDHWSAGAHVALFELRQPEVALAIQGHHIGLQSGAKDSLREMDLPKRGGQGIPAELRLSETNLEQLKARLLQDGLALPPPQPEQEKYQFNAAQMLDTRMLFSALVDADFLDTERHLLGPELLRPQPPPLQAAVALERLEARLAELADNPAVPEKTRKLRQAVAQACEEAAQQEGRLFTLTAPTGSGKTLAMLRFALGRAVRDPRIRRIVVVLPYLSILDQTAKIYRALFAEFGPHYILEDHSLAYRPLSKGLSDEQDLLERERRLLAENWEAPIILTTSVQLLESLHSNRPGACRKLHNLAGSVLLFDEVQTLPTHLAVPTLKTLARLASDQYGAVVVFATATQPAFEALHKQVQKNEPQGWQPQEMVPDPNALFSQSQRVQLDWWLKNPTPWPHLAALLKADSQALVVLNLKRQAHALFRQAEAQGLQEGLYHLSTALCPAHRKAVLEQIQQRLSEQAPCRLVATQVVEAGVELDFPVGYRALGPLEAIAQTAGRINRHGLRPEGRLVVFLPEDEGYPDRAYAQAAQLTKTLQAEGGLELDQPQTVQRYYQSLYGLRVVTDPEIERCIQTQNYAELARHYRLIETPAVNVVVPYNDEALALMQEARDQGISAAWIRQARPYAVPHYLPRNGVPPYLEPVFLRYGREKSEAPDWFLCPDRALYDSALGFTPEEGGALGLVV